MNDAALIMYLTLFAPPAPVSPAAQTKLDADAQGESAEPESEPEPEDTVLAQLEQANQDASEDPHRTIQLLSAALDGFAMFEDQYSTNAEAIELRTLSQLSLARAQLAIDDERGAAATLHAAIRDQHGDALPAERLGPTLTRFYLEQRDLLLSKGRATVRLTVPAPCEFVINGKPADSYVIDLPLGMYRVHVRAIDGSFEAHEAVALTEPDEVVVLNPDPSTEAPPAAIPSDTPTPSDTPKKAAAPLATPQVDRELRRATRTKKAGVVLLVIGGTMTVAGGVTTAIGYASDGDVGAVIGISALQFGIWPLIAGAYCYPIGKARERRIRENLGLLGQLTPTVVASRKRTSVGVSMRF